MEQNQNTSLFQLNIDANNAYALKSAASWGKLVGIVSIIIGILLVLLGILIQSTVSRAISPFSDYGGGPSMGVLGRAGLIMYGLMGLIMLLTGIFAFNFGGRASKALKTNDTNMLASGFSAVRNYFAVWGIIMIIVLLFVVIGLVGAASTPSYGY